MARVTISMPDLMGSYVNSQVQSGQYGNTSEYIRDLVRKDQENKKMAVEQLRAVLDEAEKSGHKEFSMADIKKGVKSKLGV